ncbi:MAG: pyruvate kinase [Planctomycetota bacterium]|nr:pyruvate kinase [Planctomycetota bacterium]
MTPLELLDAIRDLREQASAHEASRAPAIAALPISWRRSAANLAHYLALRSTGHIALQGELVRNGLSSLARREAHVMPTLDAVERALSAIAGAESAPARAAISIDDGVQLLARHATELLDTPMPHMTRIVVTIPPWAAGNVPFLHSLIDAGMDVARINASHGDPAQWKASIDALRTAAAAAGRRIPVCIDLAGPKVRTGMCASGPIALVAGDRLVLHAASNESIDGPRDAEGRLTAGHRVMFDDGNIRATCIAADRAKGEITVEIDAVRTGAWGLKDRKGVNVPDTDMPIAALTDEDLATLDFVVEHVDIVAMSFVRTPRDITDLHRAIQARTHRTLGVVAKVETPQACRALPEILLELMKSPPCGVMLARGDLGVEIGFEHLPEAQDEILSLCEAAHVPVIWATQVLESMTEHGFPTRGEVTDAADAARADAIMLGIGPFMVDTVSFVEDLLARTQIRRARSRALLGKWQPLGDG